jgi:PadR family transcriptional regulator, regulatory protein PadR
MGEFEQMVLLAILRLGPDAYGMEIRSAIERLTGKDVSYGAVYAALDRMERKGWVSHELGDPTPERGGRSKKYFRVERPGRDALVESRRTLEIMWEGVVP